MVASMIAECPGATCSLGHSIGGEREDYKAVWQESGWAKQKMLALRQRKPKVWFQDGSGQPQKEMETERR